MNFYIDGNMPQVGIDPPGQSHASNEASPLPPSHHGWMLWWFIPQKIAKNYSFDVYVSEFEKCIYANPVNLGGFVC